MDGGDAQKPRKTTTRIGQCPICARPTVIRYRPFCSRRCADVDLSRWLTGRYAIAGGNEDEDEDGDDARTMDPMYHSPDDESPD